MTGIGFVGLGRMGLPMALNLVKAGFRVVGCDLDPAKVAALVAAGGAGAATPAAAAAASDALFTMVMDDAALRAVTLGETGVLAGARAGFVHADLSTVSPQVSAAVAEAARARGSGFLCGKVSGSVGLAETAGLTLFASGDPGDFERCRPAFAAMAARVHHVGTGEEAAYLKLVLGLIVAGYAAMMGEALAFGEKGGLPLATMLDIIEPGPLASRQLSLKAPVLRERRFENPPSDIDTAAKDIDLALEAARRDLVPLPLTAATRQMMAMAQAQGGGKREIWSLIEAFERAAAVKPQPAAPATPPAG